MRKRVVITGVSTITPVGLNASDSWNAILRGESGIDYITFFDTEPMGTKFAGELKNFDASDRIPARDRSHMDRMTEVGTCASIEAFEQAQLDIKPVKDTYRVATMVSSSVGGNNSYGQTVHAIGLPPTRQSLRRVSPYVIPKIAVDAVAVNTAKQLKLNGPALDVSSACATGADSIAQATMMIRHGYSDVAIAGGVDASVSVFGIASFNACRALSTRNDSPATASRPFDKTRDGFVLSEGAGVVILEEYEHALRRGVEPLAEMAGFANTADAFHLTQPLPEGTAAIKAVRLALKDAGVEPDEIDYINAHGTSTQLNDMIETRIIKAVLGERAYKIPISSVKGSLGHMTGASGAAEAVFCVKAIQNSIVPPTINLHTPDPECDLDYVPNKPREVNVNVATSNSFGFGGHNTCLVFKKITE